MSSREGHIFVLSSPSGAGKTTLTAGLLAGNRNLVRSVSMTTRKPRAGEKSGEDYWFVSREEFEKTMREDGFLEWADVFGEYYGTPRRFVEKELGRGHDVLMVIDVQGAMTVKQKRPDATLIFVEPPSMAELERRLRSRNTDSEESIQKRLKVARDEMARKGDYEYRVMNDNLATAVAETSGIIQKTRLQAK